MTNSIIIDGVNVAECKYLVKLDKGNSCGAEWESCGKNPNCYFKQLKRLNNQIAEDENLQCDMREKIEELNAINLRLKQENEELKLEKRKESRCPHYCLGECSLTDGGNENGNCIGFRNCFEKLEQENTQLKQKNEELEKKHYEALEILDDYYRRVKQLTQALKEAYLLAFNFEPSTIRTKLLKKLKEVVNE